MPGKHARLSPSAAHRWMACPGSVQYDATMEETSSPAADRGTFLHDQAALRLTGGDWQPLEPEDEALVVAHVSYIYDLLEQCSDDVTMMVEQEVHITDDIWGTADAIIVDLKADEPVLHVVDFKSGQTYVPANDNPQLMIYALGAMRKFVPQEHWDRLTIHLHITQPAIDNFDNQRIVAVEFEDFWLKLQIAAQRVDMVMPQFVPGDHCTYCRGNAVCRARSELALRTAVAEFSMAEPMSLSIDEIAALLPRLKRVEDWIADVRDYALREAIAGRPVPGHKLVAGRSNREWVDEARAKQALIKAGLTEQQVARTSILTPAKAEELLGKKQFADFAVFVNKPQGKPTLVAETDNRQALIGDAFA